MNVMIVNGSYDYRRLFESLGHNIVSTLKEAQLVCFTGGEDVTPSLYGDEFHMYTGHNIRRDMEEKSIFDQAYALNIPMVGICRGAQFLNVMSGGRMYQHVEGHTRSHYITDVQTGEQVYVSSTHHQMMMPSPEAVLVASSTLGGSREWFDGQVAKRDVAKTDIEVVYYLRTNCLCFQPHPEFERAEYEGMKHYFASCMAMYLGINSLVEQSI